MISYIWCDSCTGNIKVLVVRRLPTPSPPLSVHPLTFTNTPKVSPFCPFLTSLVRDAISSGSEIGSEISLNPILKGSHIVVLDLAAGSMRLLSRRRSAPDWSLTKRLSWSRLQHTVHCLRGLPLNSVQGKLLSHGKKVRFSFLYRFPPINAFIHASHIPL